MPLNKARGNMYPFVTHTWCPIKGACPHGCSYCYMNKIYKRFGIQAKPPHLVKSELVTNLGCGNTIFVGSSIDLFAEKIRGDWLRQVINHALAYPNNTYLWHTKNPKRAIDFLPVANNFVLCVTIESPDFHVSKMCLPTPMHRFLEFEKYRGRKMVAIEPIMDFGLEYFLAGIHRIKPEQVNIGADTGNNHLPEPPKERVLELIAELEKFTKVYCKKNLQRIIGGK